MSPKLVYWDCRGRAQPIRDFLADREIAYTDDRLSGDTETNAEWPAIKSDHLRSGPFGALPVLEWNGQLIAETQVILKFLEQQFDMACDLSDTATLREAMVQSAAWELSGWPSTPIHSDSIDLFRTHLNWAEDSIFNREFRPVV